MPRKKQYISGRTLTENIFQPNVLQQMNKLITIERHFVEEQKLNPHATGELTDLLYDVAFAAKLVRREVVRAGLVDILGMAGTTNVQGEEVKKLDLFANEKIINAIIVYISTGSSWSCLG